MIFDVFKILFFLFFVLPLSLINTGFMLVNAFNLSFVELSVTPSQVKTGEIFTLRGVLINNNTEAVSGHITNVISNRTYVKGWRPPITVSYSEVPTGSFGPINPSEYLNYSVILKPRDPGKFSIYIEVTTNMGVLRSNRLEVEAYGESIKEGPQPLPIWMLGAFAAIFGSTLGLILWFKPSLRVKILSGFKGLRWKASDTISTLLAISLILAAPYIIQPFLSLGDNAIFYTVTFLRTYSSLIFFGLPVFAILHGFSTEMPTRSFFVAFVPMVASTLITNLTRPYPFVPFSAVIFNFSIALFLGLVGAGAALTKKRRAHGHILLALGLMLWAVSLIGEFLQTFSSSPL